MSNQQTVISFPQNYFKKKNGNVFSNEMEEQHAWEQFFWTRNTVEKLMKACEYVFVEKTCCFTTPSLAHGWHERNREEILLDIDTRFSYLPKFRYFDARDPHSLNEDIRLIILDPPFFVVPIEEFRKAIDVITNHNYKTKILLGFLTREERTLLKVFKDYNLSPTNFPLEYASIKSNKWGNFTLYSNIDLPGIKRK